MTWPTVYITAGTCWTGSKWPGTLQLKDRVKSTREVNIQTQVYGPLLITTLTGTVGGCPLSLGTKKDPVSLCRLSSTQSSPETFLLACQGSRTCPTESSGCLSRERPCSGVSVKAIGKITVSWGAMKSVNSGPTWRFMISFWPTNTGYNPGHVAELSLGRRFYSQDTGKGLPFPAPFKRMRRINWVGDMKGLWKQTLYRSIREVYWERCTGESEL